MKKLSDLSVCILAGSLGQGGAERQLFYMLRALKSSGAAVRVLSLTQGEFWEERIRELGIPVTWVGQSPVRLERLRTIVRQLRGKRPDILQSQHFFANIYASIASRWLGIGDIGSIRSNARDEVRGNGKLFGALNLRLPRTMIVNSEAARENAIRRHVPAERLHFLANVVDTAQFAPAGSPAADGRVRLLSAGRLIPLKRHDLLLRAAARLKAAGTAVSVTIAGSGALEAELTRLARELGIHGELQLPGALDAASIAELYRSSDIFVLTSEYEGTPNVILEAMAAGLPVVSTAVGGVPAIVADGQTGLLVPPGDEDELAGAIGRLASDAGMRKRMGVSARAFIEGRHSINSLPHALEDIYNAAIA